MSINRPKAFQFLLLLCLSAILLTGILPALRGPRHGEPKVKIEMHAFAQALKMYHVEYDCFPSGNSSGILQTLLGSNPRKTIFINIPARSTNNAGQFVDPWGTPYEIAFESTNRVTIRSVGNNKTFGDKDDVTMSAAHR